MVIGINKFKEYFKDFNNSYVIIGGTACDLIISDAGLTPRATKDIDIVLIVEALNNDFVAQFWQFIKDGRYNTKQKNMEKRKYYRFSKPETSEFPMQIELFSRNPDILGIDEDSYLTPIPTDEELSSLSAILMNDDYYKFTLEHSENIDDVNRANTEALICLKAKAYLDMLNRKNDNANVDVRNIRKHSNDIFRLALMLTENDRYELPESIKIDIQNFVNIIKNDLPNISIFKEMGISGIEPKNLFEIIIATFNLK